MDTLEFRPFKKWDKRMLLMEISKVSQTLNQKETKDINQVNYLNQLFYEAKLRRLSLSEEDICQKILFSIDE